MGGRGDEVRKKSYKCGQEPRGLPVVLRRGRVRGGSRRVTSSGVAALVREEKGGRTEEPVAARAGWCGRVSPHSQQQSPTEELGMLVLLVGLMRELRSLKVLSQMRRQVSSTATAGGQEEEIESNCSYL